MASGFVELIASAWRYGLSHGQEFGEALDTHLELVGIALAVSLVVAFPLGIWTSRSRWASLTLMNLINGVRVIPSLAILFLVIPYLGLGLWAAELALIVLALPPILINTDVAFRGLDPSILEAARGMGMTPGQVLRRVEIPLAMPVVLAGVRTATVEIISSATLAAFVGTGGLGIYVTRGFALYDYSILLVGAVPVAVLTLLAERLLAWAQRRLQPAGQPIS